MINRPYDDLYEEYFDLIIRQGDWTADTEYWTKHIEAAGEPALELGVGTGRFYIPLLERGIDIMGNDNSQAMMARCRAKCDAKGLTPQLYEQDILNFTLPRPCGLIFLDACGLGLFVKDEDILACFQSVMNNLKPGGQFIYEFNPPPAELDPNNPWTNNNGSVFGDWAQADDGALLAWRNIIKYDSATHVWQQLFTVEKFVENRLIGSEAYERAGRQFTIDEAVQYAERTGFHIIEVTQRVSDDPPQPDSTALAVRCRKPSV